VPKAELAERDFYDVWLPNVAPSRELLALGKQSGDEKAWRAFERRYRAEMKRPDAAHVLDLLAALSCETSFAVGCYCENEERCHRSILCELLAERGADLA
jgi:uncharacterized protein YeaO (DUF488 family)